MKSRSSELSDHTIAATVVAKEYLTKPDIPYWSEDFMYTGIQWLRVSAQNKVVERKRQQDSNPPLIRCNAPLSMSSGASVCGQSQMTK